MTYVAITADYQKLIKVRRALRRKGIEAYLPSIIVKRPILKASRLKYRRRVTPMMRYIIAKLPEHQVARDLWLYDIKTMKDVRGWVTIQGEPALISENDVMAVWCQVSDIIKEMDLSKKKKKRWFRAGEKARLQDGSFAGKVGSIQWVTKKRAELEIIAWGSKVITINVPIASLEAA